MLAISRTSFKKHVPTPTQRRVGRQATLNWRWFVHNAQAFDAAYFRYT